MDINSPLGVKFKMPELGAYLVVDKLLDWCYGNLGSPGSEERWEWYTWVDGRYCLIVFNDAEDYHNFLNSEVYLLHALSQ